MVAFLSEFIYSTIIYEDISHIEAAGQCARGGEGLSVEGKVGVADGFTLYKNVHVEKQFFALPTQTP